MNKQVEAKPEAKPAKPLQTISPLDEMERWLEEPFSRGLLHRWNWPSWGELTRPLERFSPRIDVIDRDGEVEVKAEVPGVNKKDLDISVTDNAVTIKGSGKREEKEEKGDYYRCEVARGSFTRTVGLPAAVQTAKAKANFEDGILSIVIPKVTKSKRRRVEID